MRPNRKPGRKKTVLGTCEAIDCTRPKQTVNWCHSHYMRQWRGDEINTPIQHQMTDELRDQIIADIKAGMTLIEGEAKYGYNRSNLSRAFKKVTGMSLREWKKKHAR